MTSKKIRTLQFVPHKDTRAAGLTLIVAWTRIFHVSQKPLRSYQCWNEEYNTYHLEERKKSIPNIVKVDVGIEPHITWGIGFTLFPEEEEEKWLLEGSL